MLSSLLVCLVIAQNALDGNLARGSGTALDRGLQQGAPVNAPSSRPDYRSRNLLVTGDVAGGRGFRGSVGYTAAEDFRGATAGDTTRAFRANSATSSADALANLAMNDRFSVATGIGATAYRRDFVGNTAVSSRPSNTAENPAMLSTAAGDSGLVLQPTRTLSNDNRVRLDLMTRQGATSTDFETGYQPLGIGMLRTPDNRMSRLLAVPFSGVVLVPSDDFIESLNHGVYSSALIRSDFRSGRASGDKILRSYLSSGGAQSASLAERAGRGSGSATTANGNTSGGQSTAGATTPPALRTVRTPYDRVIGTVAERVRGSQATANTAEMGDEQALEGTYGLLGDLRARLHLGPAVPIDETDRLLGSRGAVEEPKPQESPESAPKPKPPAKENESRLLRKLTADEAYLLLAHGEVLNEFDAGTSEALDTILKTADRAMRDGRFIWAEKVFTSAAQIAPSHPLPVAGLANAEVAAGLELSAATSLRRLFTEWPEMIDTRYAMEMLGSRARLSEIAKKSLERAVGSKHASEYGLVAAYIGNQLADDALIEQGLALMERDPEDGALTHALRVIWLTPPPPASAPPIAPTPEARPALAPTP